MSVRQASTTERATISLLISRMGTRQAGRESLSKITIMHSARTPYTQSENYLKSIRFEQRPIIPTFKAYPILFQRIEEADPFLAINKKLDDIGAHVPRRFLERVDLLGDGTAQSWLSVHLSSLHSAVAFALTPKTQVGSLHGLFYECQRGALEYGLLEFFSGKR